jgi:hypothetical protein
MSQRRAHPTDDQGSFGSRLARQFVVHARVHRQEWADDRELAHAIHGTVVAAAAMAAASLHGTLVQVVVTVLVTVAVYWPAERYARVLAVAVRGTGRLRRIGACSATGGRWSRRRTRRSSCSW